MRGAAQRAVMPHPRARKAAATPHGQGARSSSGCPRRLLDRAGSPRPHPRPRQRPRDPPRVIVGFAGADGRPRPWVGRPRARPAGVPGNPPEPRDIRGATLWGGPGGTNRATMRSAVLTVAPPLISCLHERTTPQPCDDGWSQPGCCTCAGNRWYPKRGKPGALAQLEEHLLCKQRVRGSSPLSSTAGQRPVPISETGLLHGRTAVKYSSAAANRDLPRRARRPRIRRHRPSRARNGSLPGARSAGARQAGRASRLACRVCASRVAWSGTSVSHLHSQPRCGCAGGSGMATAQVDAAGASGLTLMVTLGIHSRSSCIMASVRPAGLTWTCGRGLAGEGVPA